LPDLKGPLSEEVLTISIIDAIVIKVVAIFWVFAAHMIATKYRNPYEKSLCL